MDRRARPPDAAGVADALRMELHAWAVEQRDRCLAAAVTFDQLAAASKRDPLTVRAA